MLFCVDLTTPFFMIWGEHFPLNFIFFYHLNWFKRQILEDYTNLKKITTYQRLKVSFCA